MKTARAGVVLAMLVAVTLAACTHSSSDLPRPIAFATTTTAAPAAAVTPVQCSDARVSYAPDATNLVPGGALPSGSYMAKIRARGRLIAGVSADTLLFGFRNPFSGNLEGFDVDMVRNVAREIFGNPNKISYKVLTYAQRIPALQSGAVDIVADVMTINCTRWTQINFSSEYFTAGQRMLVRTDSKAKSIGDLNGKKVCVAKGSTNLDEMKKYPKITSVPVDDISDCMVLFQQGTVDAVTGDDTVLAGFVAQDPYAKIMGGPALTEEPYGLGIAKEHRDFVRYVNAMLATMRADGTWARMYRTWLNPTGATPPPPVAQYGRTS